MHETSDVQVQSITTSSLIDPPITSSADPFSATVVTTTSPDTVFTTASPDVVVTTESPEIVFTY